MNYIKNNKVFIFLVSVWSCVILVLAFQLGLFTSFLPSNEDNPYENVGGYESTTIVGFNGQFLDDKHSVYLTWNLMQADKRIESVAIYQDDVLLKDVSGARSIALSLEEFAFKTGNNAFQIKAKLNDDTTLEKNTYVYIDEAFDFEVKDNISDKKVIYETFYYFDARKPVSAPTVFVEGINGMNITYLNSEEIEKKGDYVKIKSTYELDFGNVKDGSYTITSNWRFDLYNLEYKSTTTLQVENGDE